MVSPRTFAVACPGQGILAKGCLAPFRRHRHLFQPVLDCVDQTLGEAFSAHLLADPPAAADAWCLATANAQPAIVTASYVTHHLLARLTGIHLARHPRVSHLLGHSLGEYSALLLGGVLDLESAVRIVRRRGELMQQLVGRGHYAMHVLVFRPQAFDTVVATARAHGVLACINNHTQILVSGDARALDAAVAAMNAGARRVLKQVPLPVTVPFHHRLLAPIEASLLLLPSRLHLPCKPIVANVLGYARTHGAAADLHPALGESGGADTAPASGVDTAPASGAAGAAVYRDTVRANSRPVQWKRSMEFLEQNGVGHVITLGPGTAVDAINARFGLHTLPLKTVDDMDAVARALA